MFTYGLKAVTWMRRVRYAKRGTLLIGFCLYKDEYALSSCKRGVWNNPHHSSQYEFATAQTVFVPIFSQLLLCVLVHVYVNEPRFQYQSRVLTNKSSSIFTWGGPLIVFWRSFMTNLNLIVLSCLLLFYFSIIISE